MLQTEAVDKIKLTYCSLNAILAHSKNFPIGANTTIDLNNITTAAHNSGV